MKRSKKYQAALELIDRNKKYSAQEALELLPSLSTSKFTGSIELEVTLKLNEKQKKESIKGSYTLPNQFGKQLRVAVISDPENKKNAKNADIVGEDDLIKEIESGTINFDVLIATPAMMPKIAKLGKVLGVRGLMPNPKNSTVTTDLENAIAKFKSGMKSYKVVNDRITLVIGKTDMSQEDLLSNYQAVMEILRTDLRKFGPGIIGKIKLAPTMGPAVVVSN